MILKQFYLNCLAQASYLIGDEASRTAAVVDPRRDVEVYMEEAERHPLEIRCVFLTHFRLLTNGPVTLAPRTFAPSHPHVPYVGIFTHADCALLARGSSSETQRAR